MIARISKARSSGDGGAYAILYALLIVLVIGLAALVIDLASMRENRRADRAASDAAALAGASSLIGQSMDIQHGCDRAMRYAEDSLSLSKGSDNCFTVFGLPATYASCPASATTATEINGGYTIKVVWPVLDTSEFLLRPDTERQPTTIIQTPLVSAEGSGTNADDGTPCDRLAVVISTASQTSFGGIFGVSNPKTTSWSVAYGITGQTSGGPAVPLVVLDPSACQALNMNGGSSLRVLPSATSITLPDGTISFSAGRISVDSVGNSGCTVNSNPVISVPNNAIIHAFDSSTEHAEIWQPALSGSFPNTAYTQGNACPAGEFGTFNQLTLTETWTGTSSTVYPLCVRPAAHIANGRKNFDATFGCLNANGYTCATPLARNYIQLALNFMQSSAATVAPAGFTKISGANCSWTGNGTTHVFPAGNYWIDCPSFAVSHAAVAFGPGIDIFLGDIDVTSSGCLWTNNPLAVLPVNVSTLCQNTAGVVPIKDPINQSEAYVAGHLNIAGSSLYAPQTFWFQHPSSNCVASHCGTTQDYSTIDTTSGAAITMTAPYDDVGAACTAGSIQTPPQPTCFSKLIMWNDVVTGDTINTGAYDLGGASNLTFDGAFFLPNARTLIHGSNNGTVTKAQFYTGRITVEGGNGLMLQPDPKREIQSNVPLSSLIR